MRSALLLCAVTLVGCTSSSGNPTDGGAITDDAASALDAAPLPDAAPVPDAEAAEAGTAGLGDPCGSAADCPQGWMCVFFTAGCQAAGRCLPGCPGAPAVPSLQPDGSLLLCQCNGQEVVNACATERYYQRFDPSAADSGACPGYDGGF